MKAHTSSFKEQIKTMGRELDSKITYTLNGVNVELGKEQLNSITPTYQGALLKSVMKELDIDSNVYIPEKTILNYQFGVKVNGEYEYINFGNYVVYKAEKQEDTNSYKLTCYDKMLYSMIDYEKMNITYPISIRDYIKAICNKLGLTFKNANSTFANYNRKINNELYLDASGNSLSYTFRDVLDELSQVTASCICINGNDELEIRYINETNDTIDEEFLKDININFGERYGAINTIVLSRSGGSDNIYFPETLPENPFEFKISDNQIMNFNDRVDYLPDIYSKLNGLEFYINDFSSTGICYYELLDRYNVKIGDNIYSCIMFNDEINITQGLEEKIYTEIPEETETDYTKADKTDRKINQTYLIVDKQNQKIESVVNQTTEQNQKIAQVTQTVEELNSKISDIADITTSAEDTDAKIELNEINQSEPIRLVIRPIGESISNLVISSNMLISDNFKLKQRILRFTNISTNEIFDYELPNDLFYYDNENYDEFILDYDGQSCVINKKVGLNKDGTTYLLENPTTVEYEFPTGDNKIILTEGNYVVEILGYDTGYIFARLMAKNIYTTQFYTKAETNSIISQTSQSIDLSVNEKLSNYSTTNEMNSAITLKAGEITNSVASTYATKTSLIEMNNAITQKVNDVENELSLEVSKKVNNTDYTHAKIVAKINDSTSSVLIEANKINLTGYLTISSASNTYASKSSLSSGTTTINGACITTGIINAQYLDTSKINATTGTIGGWNIQSSAIDYETSNYKVTITNGTNTNKDFLVVYDKTNNNYPLFARADGYLHVTKGDIAGGIIGTGINASYLTTGSISSCNIDIYNGSGFIKMLSGQAYNPYVSALNVARGSGGIVFRDSGDRNNVGNNAGQIYEYNNVIYLSASKGTNVANYLKCGNIGISGVQIDGASDTYIRLNYSVVLKPNSSGGAYIWGTEDYNKILTVGGSPSTLSVKERVEEKDTSDILDIIKEIKLYDYKYIDEIEKGKEDYGYIIDYIEKIPNIKKYLTFYESERNGIKFKQLAHEQISKFLLGAVIELEKKIERLEGQLNVN